MNYLKKILHVVLLVCSFPTAHSFADPSNSSFLYIQGDKKTPFYVKVGGEMLPKYGKNYYVISQLPAGIIGIDITFQQNAYPQQHFTVQVPENGYREFSLNKSDNGFVLYDMQQKFSLSSGNNEEDDHILGATAKPQNRVTVTNSTAIPVAKQAPVNTSNIHTSGNVAATNIKNEPAFIDNIELNNVHPQQKSKAAAMPLQDKLQEPTDIKTITTAAAVPKQVVKNQEPETNNTQPQTITIKAPETKEPANKTTDDENYHFVSITQKPVVENKIVPQQQALQTKQKTTEANKTQQTFYDDETDTVQYTPYNVTVNKQNNTINANTKTDNDNYTVEIVTPVSSRTHTVTTTYSNQPIEQEPVQERGQYSDNNTNRQQSYYQDNGSVNQASPRNNNNIQYNNNYQNDNYYNNNYGNNNQGYVNTNDNYRRQSNNNNNYYEQRPDNNQQGYYENNNAGNYERTNNNRPQGRPTNDYQQNNQNIEYSQNNNGYNNYDNSAASRQQYADNYNNANYNNVENSRYENNDYNNRNTPPARNPKIQYVETNDPNDSYSPCEKAMDSYSFNELFRGMSSQDDAERKMNFILKNYNKYCYSTAQLRMLAQAMDNERRRYAILKKTYSRTIDKENFETLKDLFFADEWRSLFRQIELQ